MNFTITGGAGFIGYHLITKLLSLGHTVVCIDDLSTGYKDNIVPFLENPRFQFVQACASSETALAEHVKNSDVIFNLAASVGVQNIFKNPIRCIENNIDIARNILNLARQFNKRLFMFSTSEVYGKSTKIPFCEEDDSVFGNYKSLRWGYAASKLIDDYMSRAYFENYGTPITIIRLFNVIGLRQVGHYGMVVPRFFDQSLSNQPITVYGTGDQSRCFTDVRDVVESLLRLIDCKESYGELVNIGVAEQISIIELAEKIKMISKSSSEIQFQNYKVAYGEGFEDIEKRIPNNNKLSQLTMFTPKITLNETLLWIYNDKISKKWMNQSTEESQV